MPEAFISAARALSMRGNLSLGLLAILAAVVTGPFDTHRTLSLPMQVGYWSVIVLGSIFIATLVQDYLAPHMRHLPMWQQALADSIGMAVLFSPLAYGWTYLLVTPLDGSLMAFHWFVLDVALISFAIFAARRIIITRVRLAAFEASDSGAMPGLTPEQEARPRLYRRIAPDDPGPIIRIEAMDHFVNVVTPQDIYQLRLRFADAVDQMDGVDGLITHRSHWVAREAVDDVERENGRVFLRVACGTRVPVSRKQIPVLEQIGLI